jgi:bacterioferritin
MAKGNPEIIAALTDDLVGELQAIVQYMWFHVTGKGFETSAILEQFAAASRDEMKHAEMLAERIDYLGGQLPTGPWNVKLYGSVPEMVQVSLEEENKAIVRYRAHIALAAECGDPTSRLLLEKILSDEEDHANAWETLLGV